MLTQCNCKSLKLLHFHSPILQLFFRMAGTTASEENTPGSTSKKEQILRVERDELRSNEVGNEKGNVPHVEYHIVSKDRVILHPQPTTDALDPLNWSACKKNSILAIVMYL